MKRQVIKIEVLVIILFLCVFLWSITKTLGTLTDKILEVQERQCELLEEINSRLDDKLE